MPDDSGRPDLTLVSEERAAREHASEPGEGAPSPPADPPTGLHYQDGTGLRLVALDLADAADGEILTKRTVEGKPTVVLEGVAERVVRSVMCPRPALASMRGKQRATVKTTRLRSRQQANGSQNSEAAPLLRATRNTQ